MFSPNGTNTSFVPNGVGTNFTLSSETSPLLPLKNDLLFLSGIDMASAQRFREGDGHAIGMSNMLTGTRAVRVEGYKLFGGAAYFMSMAGGPSIDQRIAKDSGAATRFPSLEFGVQSIRGVGPHPFSRMCYKGKVDPVPAEDDPRVMFKRLFSDGTALPAGTGVDAAIAQRKSVLDFVRDDYERLKPRLPVSDRQKVDKHLDGIREIELRLARPAGTCKTPLAPGGFNDPDDAGALPAVSKAQVDLMTVALACDLTRVASIQYSWARSSTAHSWIGVNESHHTLSHATATAKLSSINAWYASQLAYLATAMKGTIEADGTSLLDNSVIWWCSDVAAGRGHSFDNCRTILLGKCGGFFKTGQHVKFNSEPHNKLMISLMHAMGVNSNTFGDSDLGTGPLTGIS
jgi:hypothetical protein